MGQRLPKLEISMPRLLTSALLAASLLATATASTQANGRLENRDFCRRVFLVRREGF